MKPKLTIMVVLAATACARGGGVLELIPEQPGPYFPGQSVSVEVWLHNEEAFNVDLRLVALDIQGLRSRLFAGGDFLTSGGVTVNHVAKLSGSSWTALDLGTDGPVYALQACTLNGGTTLYAGGESPNPNQQYDWDATVHRMEYGGDRWSEIGRGYTARTLSFLCASDGSDQWMYAGGYLADFGGTDSRHIVKWDGSEWSAMPGLNGSVRDMLTFDDGTGPALYVAGNFPNAMPPNSNVPLYNVAKLNGTSWAPLYTGLIFGGTEWAVNALAVFDDGLGPTLYAGGDFWYSYISETDSLLPVFNIARWDGAHWFSLGGLTHSDHRPFVRDMVVFEDSCGPTLFVAGRFDNAGGVPDAICSDMAPMACSQQLYPYFGDGVPVNNIARWDGSSWSDVGGGVTGDADAAVYALAVLDDGSGPALYASGHFTSAGGVAASNIAKWDGTGWSAVGAGFDDTVHALTVHEATGDPNLIIDNLFQFDFTTLVDGGAQYAVFSDFPLPMIFYLGNGPVPGSMLQLPASGSLRLGAIDITMPITAGTYNLDLASPYGPYGGSMLSFGFDGPTDPYTDWFAETGDLTGNPVPFVVPTSPQVIVWNSDMLSPHRATRSLRFRVDPPVTATGSAEHSAIKVTMIDLQHPIPANLPAQAPPNLTTYDTRPNAVCVGGTHPGHHCDTAAHCPGAGSSCPNPVACTADPTCTNAAACTLPSNSCARWVGKPGTFLEAQDSPSEGNYRAARLQCTPFYYDWVTETASGPITVVGAEIAPSSEYSVQVYGASCMCAEDGCTNVSMAVPMFTRRSGDVEVPFNPPSTSTQPDVTDVAQLVNKFKNLSGALVKAIAQLQPNLPELNADINALDIVAVVDAVRQIKYGFNGPCACPSLVTCGALACTAPSVCTATYGAGSMCIKTCVGGANIGDPCINNSHCPGSTCGAGFCRDRCGRCKP